MQYVYYLGQIQLPEYLKNLIENNMATRQQIEQNKNKQAFLNANGVKVKIDGSWGPWQQKQYNRIKSANKNNFQSYIQDIFNNIMIGAAVADNPSVMTASGWNQNKNGKYTQKRTKESDQLASNLETVGTAAITAPTLAQDITGIYNIVRHPVQTGKAIYTTGKDIYNYGKDMYTYGKDLVQLSKVAQIAPKTVRQKYVAPYISSKMLNRSINANPKGQIIVSENYFNSPYNWYRITESPEVYGIKEMGKNVTTIDASDMYIPSNQFRLDVINNNLTFRDGYWYKPLKRVFNFSKRGSAHGNTSQAAKGHLWQGTTADSRKFPTIVLEGDMPIQTYRGFNPATGLDSRTSFHLVDSETIPMGARIGFHTGEMPIDNLGYFQRLKNGKYSYQGTIIPDKRINVENY